MNISRTVLILMASWLLPLGVFAADQVDSQMHSDVSQKVQRDHEQDLKAGKIGSHSGRSPASAQTAAAMTSPAAGGTSGTIAHPAQVQQLQKKAATPPPKVTKPVTLSH